MAIRKAVLLDTNVIISALIYGGQPETILRQVIDKQILAVTSPVLIAELCDVLIKKFKFTQTETKVVRKKLSSLCKIVHPKKHLTIVRDAADNRVLEAAIEGKCQFIITGDKELLELKKYRSVKLITPKQFLDLPS